MTNELLLRQNEEAVDLLEAAIFKENKPVDNEIINRFAEGLYSREIHLRKDQFVTSKIHKKEHFFIVSKGVLGISMDGMEWNFITAPYHGITKAGTRRMAFILEDTIFTTIHANPTNETDIEKIEEMNAEWRNKFILEMQKEKL